MEAVAIVEDEVRELIRRRGVDPARDPGGVRRLVEAAVADYDDRSLTGALPPIVDRGDTVQSVLDAVAGLGPLQRYLDDPHVEEIWINEPGKVFIARDGLAELTTTILTAEQVRDLVERMLKSSGRRVDLSSPSTTSSPSAPSPTMPPPFSTRRWPQASMCWSAAAPRPARRRCSTAWPPRFRPSNG
jgi:pilus assembly protein CpaF